MRVDHYRIMTMVAVFAAGLLALFALAIPARAAATFTVNSVVDAVDANVGDGMCATASGSCTLRAAIQESNDTSATDEISLPAGTYQLGIAGSGEDAAETGDLDVLAGGGDVSVIGSDARKTKIDAKKLDRVFDVLPGASADFSNLTITGGDAAGDRGGGIRNQGTTDLIDSTVRGNIAFDGGGLYNNSLSTVVSATTLTVTRSTINGNQAVRDGGGIRALGGVLAVNNSTISGNKATDDGGGIQAEGSVPLQMMNSTVAFNTAGLTGGGTALFVGSGDPNNKRVSNTIVSSNRAPSENNCSGNATAVGGNNLENGTSCGFVQPGDIGGPPKLGSLRNNGGPTNTHALRKGSRAIDAGGTPFPGTDQRGIVRPQRAAPDIGAYEKKPRRG